MSGADSTGVPVAGLGSRAAALRTLADTHFDVVVIGGGITGAGIAAEAAGRGLSVALLEADDFAAGTSSRSSKLIHGGLRYLAMGDFALVREGARERAVLHGMAPHLAEPRWMVLPAAHLRAHAVHRVGVALYEQLAGVPLRDRHRSWRGDRLVANEPLLDRRAFPWACAYREYVTDDARLVLAVLRSAAADGAVIANRMRVEAPLTAASGRICGVRARVDVDGGGDGDVIEVRARAVVNAAGPWAGALLRALDTAQPSPLVLSRGVHVLIDRDRLPVEHMIMTFNTDGRPVFVIPRGNSIWIGTTDSRWNDAAALWPTVAAADVDYLLAAVNRFFATPPLTPADVRSAWAGLRPLVAQGSRQTRDVSRKDEIWVADNGLVSIAGGKLTGYRPMARKAVDAVFRRLARPPAPPRPPSALPGGGVDVDLDQLASGLVDAPEAATARALVRRYGTEVAAVAALARARAEVHQRVAPTADDWLAGEVQWGIRQEMATTLEDLLYRRVRLAMFDPVRARAVLESVAEVAASELGWTDAVRTAQLAAVRARLDADLDWR